MSDIDDRMAKADADRARAAFEVTEALILAAMDPNGATMKLGSIIEQLKDQTGYSEYALTGNVQNKLRHMRKAGRVELIKGPGAGWRITGGVRPHVGAVMCRRCGSTTYKPADTACPNGKTPPPCPRCGKTEDTVLATNYGRPTGGWQHRCCGVTTWPTP